MSVEIRTVGSGKDVLYLLGYGMVFDQPGTEWLMERFDRFGLGASFVKLPTEFSDFETDMIGPCRDIESTMGDHVLIGFSLGGLTAAYLDRSRRRIFLSPFWGVNDRLNHRGLEKALHLLKMVRLKALRSRFAISEAGHFAVLEDLKGIPDAITITTIEQMTKMQSGMPPPRKGDVVYRSREDRIISQTALDGRGIPIVEYRGGHMVHLVEDRDRIFDGIVRIIRSELHR